MWTEEWFVHVLSCILQEVVSSLDVRIFLRVPEETLKQRRHERHGYHTAGTHGIHLMTPRRQKLTLFLLHLSHVSPLHCVPDPLTPPSDRVDPFCLNCIYGVQTDYIEGALWRDPPHYWEQIVWPAYVAAHQDIVEKGDVERGESNGRVSGLVIIEGLEMSMSEMVEQVCGRVLAVA